MTFFIEINREILYAIFYTIENVDGSRNLIIGSLGYDQRDAANALKRFLIGQFVKFLLLIGLIIKCFKTFVARL